MLIYLDSGAAAHKKKKKRLKQTKIKTSYELEGSQRLETNGEAAPPAAWALSLGHYLAYLGKQLPVIRGWRREVETPKERRMDKGPASDLRLGATWAQSPCLVTDKTHQLQKRGGTVGDGPRASQHTVLKRVREGAIQRGQTAGQRDSRQHPKDHTCFKFRKIFTEAESEQGQ